MPRTWWEQSITVETGRAGRYVTINSTEKAAEYMLEQWPEDKRGDAYDAAKRALLDSHDGRISAAEARAAFVAALGESNVFMFKE